MILLTLFMHALTAAPSAAVPQSGTKVGLFSRADYPPEAVRNGWQGRVVADVTVNTEGRVSGCRVVKSSGYDILDRKTCEIMRIRARFTPAKDRYGHPVESVVRTPPITWQLGSGNTR